MPNQLDGVEFQTDLSKSTLVVIIPQAYLQYSDKDWDPPSRWDEGIPGIFIDYNINSQWQHPEHTKGDEYDVSGNGTLGANLGSWRLRADWQANYWHQDADDRENDEVSAHSDRNWDWSRYYAYRAIPSPRGAVEIWRRFANVRYL